MLEFERCYSASEYRDSLESMLPKGAYWDEQLADAESDLNAWLDWRAEKLKAEGDLLAGKLKEGFAAMSVETLRDWERLAGLDGHGKTLEQRQEVLQLWRAGRLANWDNLALIVASYGMRLVRIEQPYVPFAVAKSINCPLNSRRNANTRRFVIEPLGVVVRPSACRNGFRLTDNLNKPILGANDWVFYAPSAPAGLRDELQAIMPLPLVAEILYI